MDGGEAAWMGDGEVRKCRCVCGHGSSIGGGCSGLGDQKVRGGDKEKRGAWWEELG